MNHLAKESTVNQARDMNGHENVKHIHPNSTIKNLLINMREHSARSKCRQYRGEQTDDDKVIYIFLIYFKFIFTNPVLRDD